MLLHCLYSGDITRNILVETTSRMEICYSLRNFTWRSFCETNEAATSHGADRPTSSQHTAQRVSISSNCHVRGRNERWTCLLGKVELAQSLSRACPKFPRVLRGPRGGSNNSSLFIYVGERYRHEAPRRRVIPLEEPSCTSYPKAEALAHSKLDGGVPDPPGVRPPLIQSPV